MRRCRRCDFVIVWFVFLSRCKMFSIVCWQFRFWLARSTAVRSVAVYECVYMLQCVYVCVLALKQKRLNYLKVARAQVPLLLPHLLSFCAIFYAVDFPFRLFQISQRTPPSPPPPHALVSRLPRPLAAMHASLYPVISGTLAMNCDSFVVSCE